MTLASIQALPSIPSDTRDADALGFAEIVAEDYATHDRSPLEPGFWGVAVHRFGRRTRRIEPTPLRIAATCAYAVASTAIDWIWGIELPLTVSLGRRVRLWHNGCMLLRARSIGDDVHIRHDTTFGPVRVGDPALPVIESGADLGSGVCVLGDVTVGANARVGANSVVLKSVPPRAMVLGVPARIVPT